MHSNILCMCVYMNACIYECVFGERDTLRSVQSRIGDIYIMVCAISVNSAGVPYAARFTAAVKIPLPLATFQF